MAGSGQDFELDDNYDDEAPFDDEGGSKGSANNLKDSLLKRRLIDDLLAERRLKQELSDLDFDLDDDDE